MSNATVMDSESRMLAALMNPPHNLSFDAARHEIKSGRAQMILDGARKAEADASAAFREQLDKLRQEQSIVLVVPADPTKRRDYEKHKAKLIELWKAELARDGKSPADSKAIIEEKAEKPPAGAVEASDGDKVSQDIAAAQKRAFENGERPKLTLHCPIGPGGGAGRQLAEAAQISESARRFFVCLKCNGNFVCEPGNGKSVACPCGAARCGAGALVTEDAFEVTRLVESGKLTVVLPTPAEEKEPTRVVFAVNNRCARNVEQRADASAAERVARAAQAISRGVLPAADYVHRAAGSGAKVFWHSHYHSRAAGTERTADRGEFVRREPTGDARFFGQVIVRDLVNEADGTLQFHPVFSCARCGGDHKEPLAFWKLARPVCVAVAVTPGCPTGVKVVGTHFAMCPANAEPIYLTSAESEADQTYTKPFPPGTPEEAMKPIDAAGSIAAKSLPQPTTVSGVGGTGAYSVGFTAGERGDVSPDANPYQPKSAAAEEWQRGFVAGRAASNGD